MKSNVYSSFLLLVALLAICSGARSETVTFRSTETTFDGKPLMLEGELVKPSGDGPFPAVVLLHPCGGRTRAQNVWADLFANWGYVSLIVDSFGPRGIKEVCTDGHLAMSYSSKRAQDAADARTYLATLSFIDSRHIAVAGWSHGAWTVLETLRRESADPFQAGVAFYPNCNVIPGLKVPVLILIGDLDDWTPAAVCRNLVATQKAGPEIMLNVYPGVCHGFDIQGIDRIAKGTKGSSHRLKYDKEAAADARIKVKEFLEKYLK
ncbi:MAG: dienelactone hydrolase family protein [Syntrophorhabdales bacterium]|jgi:dienelactone hydrolase